MILYFDTSAIIKRYVKEPGSEEVRAWFRLARTWATGLITRVEMASALSRLLRMKIITQREYITTLEEFRSSWVEFERLPITEALVARADLLACEHGLRAYDAVHLASALVWQEALTLQVTIVTYDGQLAAAGKKTGLAVLPE